MNLKFDYFNYKENLEKQRELFADAFAEVEDKSLESYYWQFHQYPNEDKRSYEYCAYINNEMVGYYAAVPYRYKIGDIITDVGMVCGVMTSSRHRGKGIFTQLGKYSTEELSRSLPFTTGYPIRKDVIPGHLKVGWKIAFELPLYIKFIKLDSLLKKKGVYFASFILNPFLSLYNFIFSAKGKSVYKSDFYTNISSIEGYDTFVKQWIESVPIALMKDSKFAKWRYDRPGKNYQFLVIKKQNKIIGFASYCSIIKEGVPSFCLLDLMVLPDDRDCIGFLFKKLYEKAKVDNVEAILFMMSKLSAKHYKVGKNGYIKSPYKFFLIIKNLTNEFHDDKLLNEANWHLMWVDSDDL